MSTVADITVIRRSEATKSGAASQPPPHPIAAKNARRSMSGTLTPKRLLCEPDAGLIRTLSRRISQNTRYKK
jgi:hypothetical protein